MSRAGEEATGVADQGAASRQQHAVPAAATYRVHGVSHPGGHGRIRCGATDVKADTGSISDGLRPGPAELLCASLAACLLKNLDRFSELLPFRYDAAYVEVQAERQAAPPKLNRLRYRIDVVTDEPAARVGLLHKNIRKFGTITNTLAGACELTGELVARPSDGGGVHGTGHGDVGG